MGGCEHALKSEDNWAKTERSTHRRNGFALMESSTRERRWFTLYVCLTLSLNSCREPVTTVRTKRIKPFYRKSFPHKEERKTTNFVVVIFSHWANFSRSSRVTFPDIIITSVGSSSVSILPEGIERSRGGQITSRAISPKRVLREPFDITRA